MQPVHVRRISLHNFFSHGSTTVEVPAKGLVLITGLSGAGKSSLIDGVSMALGGRTLRGTSPWTPGVAGAVDVTTTACTITRERTRGGKNNLEWAFPGHKPAEWETPSKAAAALAETVGPWELWARTHVFSAKDAAYFAEATDAERKRLLEALLGIDAFDIAFKAADTDLKDARKGLTALQAEMREQEGAIRGADAALAAMPLPPPEEALDEARRALAKWAEEVPAWETANRRDVGKVAELDGVLAGIERSLRELQRSSVCTQCKRPFDNAADHYANIAGLEAQAAQVLPAHTTARDIARASRTALDGARRAFQDARDTLARLEEQEKATKHVAQYRELLAATRATLVDTKIKVAVAENNVATLEAVTLVLGTRGARGGSLAAALECVSSSATRWVGRLGRPDWSITLAPSTALKGGDTKESIALIIDGPAHGEGYKGLSNGEQKRVALALLLALGDLAQAASEHPPGTMWFDEALGDPLDAEGSLAASAIMRDLAAERAVVVIAHSPNVIDTLRPDHHWDVTAGVLTVLR